MNYELDVSALFIRVYSKSLNIQEFVDMVGVDSEGNLYYSFGINEGKRHWASVYQDIEPVWVPYLVDHIEVNVFLEKVNESFLEFTLVNR